jgi:hypothetical protein
MDLIKDRDQWRALVYTVMNIQGKFLSNCKIGGFSRRAQLREDSCGINSS